MKSANPIGIFDSGIGGLTVASAIHQLLPKESLIYFGDTAHFPYGDKSPDSIKYYSIRIADFLAENNCKAVVIACNTASSIAYEAVNKHLKGKIPVISVIEPTVQKILSLKDQKKVGVIGTKGTVKSNVYAKKIEKESSELEVASLATPLLAPMIEEGFFNNKISRTIINSYLSRPKLKKIDSLILACTHYPLIKKEIEEFYKGEVEVIDSCTTVAECLKDVLKKKDLLRKTGTPSHSFYVSDYTESFQKSTAIFFKGKVKLQHMPLWEND